MSRGWLAVILFVAFLVRIPFWISVLSGSLAGPLAIGMWALGIVATWIIVIYIILKSRKKAS